jgi:Domain of unknown function (DUF4136)
MTMPSTTSHGPRFVLGLAMLAITAAACSKFTIRTDRAAGADFARYRTFAWFPIADVPPDDQTTGDRALDKRIYEAIERQMEQKGYAPAASTGSDLLLTYRLLRTDGYEEPKLPYQAQWHRGAYLDALHASSDTYQRGTLIIDVVDRSSRELVWRGSASARLQPHTSYDATVKRANAAIEQTLASFPAR